MTVGKVDIPKLQETAGRLRCNIIKMIAEAGSGHNGGAMSAIDVLVYLYFQPIMRVDTENIRWADRDRFVLSKGHCCPALYVTLAERGFFPESMLWTLRDIESKLQGHPDMNKTPGVDMTTGSLGQGISCAVGMAIAGKLSGRKYNVYAMVGDGELQEGQVWEAAMAAAHHKLDNLFVVVDNNKVETDGPTREINNVEPISPRWESFGWNICDVDGHDFGQIHQGFQQFSKPNGKPSVIVADTIKGKGISFMEGDHFWHAGPTSPEQTEQALKEIHDHYIAPNQSEGAPA